MLLEIDNNLLVSLIALSILVLFTIIYSVLAYKNNGNKKKAIEFLNSILNEIKNVVLNMLTTIRFSDLKDPQKLQQFVDECVQKITDAVWDYVQSVVEKGEEGAIDEAALAFLKNKEFIEKYVKGIVEELSVKEILQEKGEARVEELAEETIEASEKEDQELQEKFADQTKYIENVTDNDQTKGEDVDEPTEEELSKLNPQTDEGYGIDPLSDDSVEVLNDDGEVDEIFYDKAGRARSKATGRYVKTKK